MPQGKEPIRFRCPLCGSSVYETVVVTLPSGVTHKSSLFECAGCSVVFRDKGKFTKRAKYVLNNDKGRS